MTRKHAVCTILAGGLLVVMACSAAQIPLFEGEGFGDRTFRALAHYTGADGSYGFFAPSVASQVRAVFTLSDDEGNSWQDTLEGNRTRETELRFGSLLGQAMQPETQEAVVQSWAAQMLGRHPTATELLVRVEVYDMPTMEQYRAGERPEWNMLYEVTFTRESALRATGD
jgi:hypothetical protein